VPAPASKDEEEDRSTEQGPRIILGLRFHLRVDSKMLLWPSSPFIALLEFA
jgi:hypothetical protein